MTEYRAKPKGLGWVLQEKRFGFWRTCHRSYNGGEASYPIEYDTLEEARRGAGELRLKANARIEEARRIAEHEQKEPVEL